MARGRNGQVFDYGLKLMPDNFLSRATPEQRRIFDHYKK